MRSARRSTTVECGLIGVGLVLLAVAVPHRLTGDGHQRYLALSQLLAEHRVPYGDYSLVGPLFAAPLWFAGWLTGDPATVLRYQNLALLVLGLGAGYLLLRRRLDGATLRRFLLLLIAGSMVAVAVADFYGEMFTVVTVGIGLLAATRPARADPPAGRWGRNGNGWIGRLTGWIAVTLGAANTPASLVALGMVSGAQTLRARRLRLLVPFLAGMGLVAMEIVLRHGGYAGNQGSRTVMPYSGRPGFSYPFLLGVAAILFSFGRGLVFFIPGLALPARRRLRARDPWLAEVYLLWMLFLGGLVVGYASWWAWYGGMTWGPRFFLIGVLPAALALAVRLPDDASGPAADLATLGVLVLSLWVGAASSAFGHLSPPECQGDLEFLCHFTPEFSPLWYPFVAKPGVTAAQWLTLAYHAVALVWLAGPVAVRLARFAAGWVREQAPGG